MPSMNGVQLSVAQFLEHAGPRIPNLAGAKYTHEKLADYFEALRLDDGKYDLLWGRDEMLLGALAMGARGGVGSTYNTDAPLYLDLIDAFTRGDIDTARDLQADAVALVNDLASTGDFLASLKSRLRTQNIQV
jgi:N-acetylneuraminate lyase